MPPTLMSIDIRPCLAQYIPQVQQQGELIDDQRQPGAVADGGRRVTAVPFLAPDGPLRRPGQQADTSHVVMQVLTADADVPEWSLSGPDAVGECPQRGKGASESQPAEQRRLLAGAEFLVVCAAEPRPGMSRG
jgi:hypothetical protein